MQKDSPECGEVQSACVILCPIIFGQSIGAEGQSGHRRTDGDNRESGQKKQKIPFDQGNQAVGNHFSQTAKRFICKGILICFFLVVVQCRYLSFQ